MRIVLRKRVGMVVCALLLSTTVAQPAAAATTHWTGWYSVYKSCGDGAQMHWENLSSSQNRVGRHYFRGALTSADYNSWSVRMTGYSSGSDPNYAYSHPAPPFMFGPYTNSGNCNWVNGSVDYTYTSAQPSVTHEFWTDCDEPSCTDFGYSTRIVITGAGTWSYVHSNRFYVNAFFPIPI